MQKARNGEGGGCWPLIKSKNTKRFNIEPDEVLREAGRKRISNYEKIGWMVDY